MNDEGGYLMKPTIKDVANYCGYSITTVSFVLNNKDVRIPEDTKQKVFEAAKALNYRPNQIAVSMVTRKTNIFGLIIPDISNMFFAELSKVIEVESRKCGYNVIYGNNNDEAKMDIEILNLFLDRGVDGIIIARSANRSEKYDRIFNDIVNSSNIPIIAIDRVSEEYSFNAVVVDHVWGGYLATQHLLKLGHRRIGCITGPKGQYTSEQRLEGYKKALDKYGVAYDEDLISEGDYSITSGSKNLPYLLGKDVTSIFAFNDMTALGVYRDIKKFGMKIPDDISIVGYDDIMLSPIFDMPLTTVHQPIKEIGKNSIKLMLNLMSNGKKKEPEIIKLKPSMMVRESTKLKVIK